MPNSFYRLAPSTQWHTAAKALKLFRRYKSLGVDLETAPLIVGETNEQIVETLINPDEMPRFYKFFKNSLYNLYEDYYSASLISSYEVMKKAAKEAVRPEHSQLVKFDAFPDVGLDTLIFWYETPILMPNGIISTTYTNLSQYDYAVHTSAVLGFIYSKRLKRADFVVLACEDYVQDRFTWFTHAHPTRFTNAFGWRVGYNPNVPSTVINTEITMKVLDEHGPKATPITKMSAEAKTFKTEQGKEIVELLTLHETMLAYATLHQIRLAERTKVVPSFSQKRLGKKTLRKAYSSNAVRPYYLLNRVRYEAQLGVSARRSPLQFRHTRSGHERIIVHYAMEGDESKVRSLQARGYSLFTNKSLPQSLAKKLIDRNKRLPVPMEFVAVKIRKIKQCMVGDESLPVQNRPRMLK